MVTYPTISLRTFIKNKNGFQIIESNVKPTDSYLLLNIVIFLLELLLNAKIL